MLDLTFAHAETLCNTSYDIVTLTGRVGKFSKSLKGAVKNNQNFQKHVHENVKTLIFLTYLHMEV